jgi:molecular chaperone Hsp33
MSLPSSSSDVPSRLEVKSFFVRHRNALLTRAVFSELFVDYYLHLAEHQLRHKPEQDSMLKHALAAMLLHCASRPWNETIAWTLSFQDPKLNLFVTGDNQRGQIIGHLFDENVKDYGANRMFAETIRGREQARQSVVEFKGNDVFRAVESFYEQSEQRTARLFEGETEEFLMLSSQPDCDLDWLNGLKEDEVMLIGEREEISLLEKRAYLWRCGCSHERILDLLVPSMREDPESLFGDEDVVRVHCPRCGARHTITHEALEARVRDGSPRQG